LSAARSIVLPLVYFSAFFLFVLLYVEPGLVYVFNGIHKFSYVIEFTKEYFVSLASAPGGCAKLAISLFVEACFMPWLGALLITAAAVALFAGSRAFCRNAGIKAPSFLFYAPCALFIPLVARYNIQYLPAVIAAIGSILLCVLYQRYARTGTAQRTVVFSVLSLASYYLFSLEGSLFIVCALVDAAFSGKKRFVATMPVAAAVGAMLWIFKALLFPFDRIFNHAETFDFSRPIIYFYVFIPVLALGFNGKFPRLRRQSKPGKFGKAKTIMLAWGAALLAILPLAISILFVLDDWQTQNVRTLGQVVNETRYEQWDKLLDKRTSPVFLGFPAIHSRTQLIACHAMYRALYHAGRLGSDMLTFPQACDPEPLLLYKSAWNIYFPAWALGLDAAIDLGSLNFAEKLCGEAMENMGPLPYFGYRRAMVQIAKGNKELAAVYLRKVQHMPRYGAMARRQLASLGAGNPPSPEIEPDRIASSIGASDLVFERASEEDVLLDLLKTDPRNKMAFEYLMAYYLLSRRPDKIAGQLYRIDDFGYSGIPRLYEEAFSIFQGMSPDSAALVRMPKCGIRRDAFDRRDRFLHALDVYGQQAPSALMGDFGSSYFYLYTFGSIPGGNR